jgi:hypothetical protein
VGDSLAAVSKDGSKPEKLCTGLKAKIRPASKKDFGLLKEKILENSSLDFLAFLSN